MRLFCLWCAVLALVSAQASDDRFYAPQTFTQHIEAYQQGLFKPASKNDVTPQSSISEPWRPAPVYEHWRPVPAAPIPAGPSPAAQYQSISKPVEPWRSPLTPTKEQQANILHHKQALTSEGSFRFEYASDNGLAAGEVIEPDGSRVGAYQYKDPNGQVVKLKYRAGKDGFQILEGSHLPKSPEPVLPPQQENHYQHAYEQQRQQYILQQQHDQEKPKQQTWIGQTNQGGQGAVNQYFSQNLQNSGREDDGQYRENEIEQDSNNRGPHSFGEGYAFSFQG